VLATTTPWSARAHPPDLGLAALSGSYLPKTVPNKTWGGSPQEHERGGLEPDPGIDIIPAPLPPVLLRATIPRGSLPEQWWLAVGSRRPKAAGGAREQTGRPASLLMPPWGQQIGIECSNTLLLRYRAYQHTWNLPFVRFTIVHLAWDSPF